MKIIKINKANIEEIIEILKKGGLVIMPTETVYGAFVDATNPKAVEKLNKYKKRPFGKPYSVAVSDQKMAEKYVHLNKTAKNLYKNFLPGPLTVVSKSKGKVSKGVESEEKTLGIRIPDYPFVLEVIKKYKKPLTATSANASYKKNPYTIKDILGNLSPHQKKLIDLIVNAGRLPKNKPSTVVDTTQEESSVIRQGEIKIKNKNKFLSKDAEGTQSLAKSICRKYAKFYRLRPIIFALEGKMGAGKTVFTKGLGSVLGIKEDIKSPTYDIIAEHKGKEIKLFHIDVWRIEDKKEIEKMGLEKLLKDNPVVAIEWADKIDDIIRKHSEDAIVIWVKINYGKKENEREITWGVL